MALSFKTISHEEAKRMMESVEKPVILDVREADEYREGHIEGAILLPLSRLNVSDIRRAVPDTAQKVLLYCHSGLRAARAAKALYGIGYENVYNMGGIEGWQYPFVTGK